MKKLLSIILASTIIFTLASCGGDEPEVSETQEVTDESPVVTDPESVTLKTVSMFGGTDPTRQYYEAIIDDYEDKYDVIVEDISSTSDETWKISVVADFQVGNEPDVLFYFTGVDAEPIIQTGKVVDIETIRAEYPEYGSIINEAAMEFMVEPDGNTYALPIRGFWEGLFVNKDLFEKHDLELPTNWKNFDIAVSTFAKTDIVPIAVSFADIPHYWIEHLVLSTGGIDEHKKVLEPGVPAPDSWVEGLDLLTTLNEMGAFSPDSTATSNDSISQLFKDKKAAMIVDGSWFLGGITDQDNTTVMAFPSYKDAKDPTDIIGGFSSGFYITTVAWDDPAKREAAVNFVMEMTTKEAITEFAKVGGAPAAKINTPDGLTPLQTDGAKFSSEALRIDMPIDSRLTKNSWDYIVYNISNIVDGSASAREVLDQAANFNQ